MTLERTHAQTHTHTHFHVWFPSYVFTDSIDHNRSQRVASGIAILASDEWEEMQNEVVKTAKHMASFDDHGDRHSFVTPQHEYR